jgi:hypothetical protein
MDAQRYDQGRQLPVWFSPYLLALVLSPVLLQTSTPLSCGPPGDATLSALELEVLGENQIVFDSAQRKYTVWLPVSGDVATVRATSRDPAAQVTYTLRTSSGFSEAGDIGVGGGEISLDLPLDPSWLMVLVEAPEGAVRWYKVQIRLGCSDCDDGDECTADVCDPVLEMCVHPPVVDGAVRDFGGLPGLCAAGICEEDPCADVDCDDGNECTVDVCDRADGTCTYNDTCTDYDSPVLLGFDFDPQQVDVSTQSQDVTCSVTAVDSPAGVDRVQCYFNHPPGHPILSCDASLSSGDIFDGTWSCPVTIPRGTRAGTALANAILTDSAGNSKPYRPSEIGVLGAPTELDIIMISHDAEPPVLIDFDANPQQVAVATQSQHVIFSMTGSDDDLGVNVVELALVGQPSGSIGCGARLSSGDRLCGTWECDIDATIGYVGTWTVGRITLWDNNDNFQSYFQSDLQALGFPTQLVVTYY